MSAPEFSLLTKRRFAPLFVVQFLGAFNDNLLKFSMLFLASFGIYAADPDKAVFLATIATGIFILPYFLFSAMAGQMADAYDKSTLLRYIKGAEVILMGLALVGFQMQSIPILLTTLFLMGLQSTMFGPVKYAILPQHLKKDEIMGGTGLVEAGTFLAILGGQLLAGLIAPWIAGVVAVGLASIGFIASLAVPSAPPTDPDLKVDRNIFASTFRVVGAARKHRAVWLSILGIGWFFAAGAILLSELTPLVSGVLQADKEVTTLFLVIFSVSVAIGSLAVNKLLGGRISARFVPVSAFGLSICLIDLWLATRGHPGLGADKDIAGFLASDGSFRLMFDLFGVGLFGGMYVVPLYAILQTFGPPEERSRTIAASNIVTSFIVVLITIVAVLLIKTGTTVQGILGALGFATLFVAFLSVWLLPEVVFKAMVRWLLKLLYRVEVHGAQNMPKPGVPSVVVVNHVSFLDGILLGAFLPGKPTFALSTDIANSWWIRPFLPMFEAFPVDPTNPMSTKTMVKAVKEGRTLVIFPEGRITVTGALMKIFDGPGLIAAKSDAAITPVRIEGAQYTPFSRLKGKVRLRLFPKITLTILEPRRFEIEGEMSARERRAAAGRKLYDEMSQMIFATSDTDRTLYSALLEARHIFGHKAPIVEDVNRKPLSYSRLVTGSEALGHALSKLTKQREFVGLMMPNVNSAVATFFALQSIGRVPAMLNFTAGLANLKAACLAGEIQTIITARAFVEQGNLIDVVAALEGEGINIIWLEDVGAGIGKLDKLRALWNSKFAARRHKALQISSDDPAVVLFTSGSEGSPKGVVLTHRNLLSNCRQLAARVDFNQSDTVLNALPIFHSFGLTGGTLLPILHGVRVVLYPSPLHYRIVPAMVYASNATIMFGTDTFLAGYARMAHSYDFYSLRYIFAGAERVKDETRQAYADKFGLRILEGYGATEASPVIAVNTPMHYRSGTVGRLLPGVEARLEHIEGIERGGRAFVKGPNIMAGYLKADKPGILQPPEDGWHDTGDIIEIDDSGFVTILGRVKRFTKIGGEMISLPAVEGYVSAVWPNAEHAIVSRPDPRKGEQLVLFTTEKHPKLAALRAWGKEHGVAELAIPRDIRVLDEMPLLGTGKLDYATLNKMAVE
ncbi:MAG: acyl-[ACP]--phospholipid O-acyltransferase [Marinosulfonomonas sp.]